MPRNRTVRVAVLGSSVQRAAASGSSSTRSGAVRRRIIVGVLLLLSVVLITLSFRSTALDPVQRVGVSVLRPFEVAANRVARPFRDAASWTRGIFDAKAENRKLTKELAIARQNRDKYFALAQQNKQLLGELNYVDSPAFPTNFNELGASVLTNASPPFDQTITISAGSANGIALEDVVVATDPTGLVGQVTKVYPHTSKVMLITDPDSAVRADDANHPAAGGILGHGSGTDSLVLNNVTKEKPVNQNDTIITAGSPGKGLLPSIFPRDIPIGTVTSVGQTDTDIYKEIQIQPFVDISGLESVVILIPKLTAPPAR